MFFYMFFGHFLLRDTFQVVFPFFSGLSVFSFVLVVLNILNVNPLLNVHIGC